MRDHGPGHRARGPRARVRPLLPRRRRRAGGPAPDSGWRSCARWPRGTAGPSAAEAADGGGALLRLRCRSLSKSLGSRGTRFSFRRGSIWGHDDSAPSSPPSLATSRCARRLRRRSTHQRRRGGQPAEPDAQDALLDYARCMRENGVDMPDPEVRGQRARCRLSPAGKGVDRGARCATAEQACAQVPGRGQAARDVRGAAEGVQEGGAGERAAACASTASTSPTRVRRERRGAASRSAAAAASTRRARSSRPRRRRARSTLPKRPGAVTDRRRRRRREARDRRRRRRRGAGRGRRVVLAGGGDPAPRARPPPRRASTATVERRDLVDRETRAGHARLRRRGHAARRRRRHAHRPARPGRGGHARPLALRRRRRAGGLPALRLAARLARLHARA